MNRRPILTGVLLVTATVAYAQEHVVNGGVADLKWDFTIAEDRIRRLVIAP